jgi:hypothetical protein
MAHRPGLFTGRAAKLRGVVLSVACLALLAFVVLPSSSQVSFAAVYAKSAAKAASSTISGTFTKNGKTPLKGQKVKIVFKDATGKVIKTVTVKLDRNGEFDVRAPRGAAEVTIKASKGGVNASQTFPVKRGHDLEITAVLPPKNSGLLPGIFPY